MVHEPKTGKEYEWRPEKGEPVRIRVTALVPIGAAGASFSGPPIPTTPIIVYVDAVILSGQKRISPLASSRRNFSVFSLQGMPRCDTWLLV